MSWLSRLFRCKRRAKPDSPRTPGLAGSLPRAEVVGDAPELPLPEPPVAETAAPPDPFEAAALIVAGLDPLGGDRDQLRLTYSGTWDGPVFVTVTFGGVRGGAVSVVDPGDEFRQNVMAVLSKEPAVRATTRQERRADVPTAALAELRALFDSEAWTLGEGELRGCDGHWITVEVFSPSRGAHRGRDWCPYPATAIGRITAATARVAALADPAITGSYWIERLSR